MSEIGTNFEDLAGIIEASGQYRVLRKLNLREVLEDPGNAEIRSGLVVDLETTGLDPSKDEIIELALVPFTYSLDGRIFEIGEVFQSYREPGCYGMCNN